MNNCLNSIGLIFDMLGAILIGYEIWSPFKDKKYRDDVTLDETNEPVRETNIFSNWESRKYKLMFAGLCLLVVGFLLQLASNFMSHCPY